MGKNNKIVHYRVFNLKEAVIEETKNKKKDNT